MKVMKNESKPSMFMALLWAVFGALVTTILYFIIAKMGIFSAWVGAIGVTISAGCYCFYREKPGYSGIIFCIILNILGVIFGEILFDTSERAKVLGKSIFEILRGKEFFSQNFKYILSDGNFWVYPGVGAVFTIIAGFYIGRNILKAKRKHIKDLSKGKDAWEQ